MFRLYWHKLEKSLKKQPAVGDVVAVLSAQRRGAERRPRDVERGVCDGRRPAGNHVTEQENPGALPDSEGRHSVRAAHIQGGEYIYSDSYFFMGPNSQQQHICTTKILLPKCVSF